MNVRAATAIILVLLVALGIFVSWNYVQNKTNEDPGLAVNESAEPGTTLPITSGPSNTLAEPKTLHDQYVDLIVGKWKEVESNALIYNILADGAFQESRLVANGQFMVPQGTWKLEQQGETFIFVRTNESGEIRRFRIIDVGLSTLTLKDEAGNSSIVFTKMSSE